jgi:biotin carboxylase
MNLLVTNTRNAQAYAIIRALRPYAQKIVVSMYGANRLAAGLSHAANSRLVDKRYFVPSPVEDWRAGRIQRENTEREEAYVQAVLRICDKEKIDTLFPSLDPHVYVFSKNKERFEIRGVLIPVPDYETVLTPLDKYRTALAAQEAGFPCPRTYLPESEDDLRRIAAELGFPLVIRPRFTLASRGMEIVSNFSQLSEKASRARKISGLPMIQEYIPGNKKQVFYIVLDKKGDLKVAFCPKTWRLFMRLYRNSSSASESSPLHPYVNQVARLVRRVGWWGGATVQTKIDARDGLPKLMEINPRLGTHLWYRTELGINEPLMCIKVARGEEVETAGDYPTGVLLLEPIEDAIGIGFALLDLLIYKLRTGILGKRPIDSLNPPMAFKEIFQSCKQTYCDGRKKVFNPHFRYFFQDPLVSILWWLAFFKYALRARKQLGR